jgi:hypothetical protein
MALYLLYGHTTHEHRIGPEPVGGRLDIYSYHLLLVEHLLRTKAEWLVILQTSVVFYHGKLFHE